MRVVIDNTARIAELRSLPQRVQETQFPPCTAKTAGGLPCYRRIIDPLPKSGIGEVLDITLKDIAGVTDRDVIAYVLYHGEYYPAEPDHPDFDGGRALIASLADLEPYGRLLQPRLLSTKQRFDAWLAGRAKKPTKRRRKW
jgi:hypothetical protein